MHALTITSANCVDVTGMSWKWLTRFCATHGVPVLQVGTRKRMVQAHLYERALAQLSPEEPTSDASGVESVLEGLRERHAKRKSGMLKIK